MSKELEALERYHNLDVLKENENGLVLDDKTEYDTIKQALQKLEQIENSKSSDALKWLEKYKPTILFNTTIVENTLLKAQELEKENARYKQLEKEVGIPLEIAFRALKEGIYIEKGQFPYTSLEKHNIRGIELYGLGVISNICSYGDCDFTCLYKDYKKCWWLKVDKSE